VAQRLAPGDPSVFFLSRNAGYGEWSFACGISASRTRFTKGRIFRRETELAGASSLAQHSPLCSFSFVLEGTIIL